MYLLFALVGLIVLTALLLAIWLFVNIDDWSRDLTTNQAATSASAKQPSLHPILSELPQQELADRVVDTAKQLVRWELVAREERADETTLRLIRTTRLMRFQDDITVHIRPVRNSQPPCCEISAESRSRVGQGDFGQNPRNLSELMDKIRFLLR